MHLNRSFTLGLTVLLTLGVTSTLSAGNEEQCPGIGAGKLGSDPGVGQWNIIAVAVEGEGNSSSCGVFSTSSDCMDIEIYYKADSLENPQMYNTTFISVDLRTGEVVVQNFVIHLISKKLSLFDVQMEGEQNATYFIATSDNNFSNGVVVFCNGNVTKYIVLHRVTRPSEEQVEQGIQALEEKYSGKEGLNITRINQFYLSDLVPTDATMKKN